MMRPLAFMRGFRKGVPAVTTLGLKVEDGMGMTIDDETGLLLVSRPNDVNH